MKSWDSFFKIIIVTIGLIILFFNVQFYNLFEDQKNQVSTISDQQKADTQANSNKFKDQDDKIAHISKDLEEAQQQIKDQADALAAQKDELESQKTALLQEVEKTQRVENDGKIIQTSLTDIKAEADAIKQDMKGWQKDYVTILADLEKKIDYSHEELKSFEDNFNAVNIPELKENINSLKDEIQRMNQPPQIDSTTVPPAAPETEKKLERTDIQSP